MFDNIFSFEGRIGRSEFAISLLFYFPLLLFSIVSNQIVIITVSFVFLSWFICAQRAKRCHDLGKSGWWQFIPFYIFWLIFQKGDSKTNQYGKSITKNHQIENSKKRKTVPQNHFNSIQEIKESIGLLESSFIKGLFSIEEYDQKMLQLKNKRKKILEQTALGKEFNENKKQLTKLLEKGIITKSEYDLKLGNLKKPTTEVSIKELTFDSQIIYLSHGPITVMEVIKHIKSNKIHPNCFIKQVNESSFNKRAKDLLLVKKVK